MMTKLIPALLLLMQVVACDGDDHGGGSPKPRSAVIEGRVLLDLATDFSTEHIRKPLDHTVVLVTDSSGSVARWTTDEQGQFTGLVTGGSYDLALAQDCNVDAPGASVEVEPGGRVDILLACRATTGS